MTGIAIEKLLSAVPHGVSYQPSRVLSTLKVEVPVGNAFTLGGVGGTPHPLYLKFVPH